MRSPSRSNDSLDVESSVESVSGVSVGGGVEDGGSGNNGGGVVHVSGEGRGVLSGVEVVGSSGDVLKDSAE